MSTYMDADDLDAGPASGQDVIGFTFSSANFNASDVTASPTVVFWEGDSGAPGNVVAGFRFNPITLGANSAQLWTITSASPLFTIPSGGFLFMGVSWDDFGDQAATGATQTEIGNLGQAIFDPPTVGSSGPQFWSSDNFGNNYQDFPAGALYGNPMTDIINFGDEIITADPVPEPASLAVIGLGLAGLAARKRRKA
ncbi:MAG: PEP-CTERM sorting domain-containing protein [Armatimonadetes bacterium]|nr:PEP-CTERM sorting domain-containing protein [Armatimonadota bacterium]